MAQKGESKFHAIQGNSNDGFKVIARSTGKALGHFSTREGAIQQLRAVEYSKHLRESGK